MGRWSRLAVVVGMCALLVLPAAAQGANGNANYRAVCPSPPAGYVHCHELVVVDSRGNPSASTSPTGLSPATIRSVYGFPTSLTAGAGQTIAIVDAYDDPTAENDLNVFSNQYGLPQCTTANGCFTKVNQTGGTSYPKSNSGWALEISLDIQWAHAIAPGAKILLVEASSNSFTNLLAAEDYARQHAQYVSNSWGGSEFNGEGSYDSRFLPPSGKNVSFFVSAGDSGLPAEYPSASPNVISVGGTTLTFNSDGSLRSETGWSSGGGGCSAYESATSAQSSFSQYGQAGCGSKRATPDVSLDADPSSGVSVYDSTPYFGKSGWFTIGGTSASSPMWAAASADAGALVNSAFVYGSNIAFRDVVQGNNGAPCLIGYDLCSGNGSWLYSTSAPPPSQASLSFATGSQTLTAGQISSPIQVGVSPVQASSVAMTVSSSSQQGQFATSAGGPWSPSLTVTISAGVTTSPGFYYQDTKAGTPTLTATASSVTSAGQTETVTAAALAGIAVSPVTATITVGGSQIFTAGGTDQYGNPVSVSGASWTTSAPGTLSPTSGTSTTFTASSTSGSGSVTATVGSIAGVAAVTVSSTASTHQLGNSTVGTVAAQPGAGYKFGSIFTASENGTGVDMRVYVAGGSAQQVFEPVVYSASGGSPSSLLAVGSQFTVAAGQAAGWVTTQLPAFTINSGQSYLLGLLSGSNANAAKVYALNSNNSGHWNANDYPTASTTWGADNVESLLWSFVLDYTTGTGGGGTGTAPVNTTPPSITGTAQQGLTLTGSEGVWTGSPTPTLSDQWRRCDSGGNACTDIVGATALTYTLAAADVGSTIRFQVTASNSNGTVPAVSAATSVVAASGSGISHQLGNSTVGTVAAQPGAGYKFGSIFTASENGTGVDMRVYVAGGSAQQVFEPVVYSASGGSPSSLLAVGSQFTVAAGQAAGWVTTQLPPFTINSGQSYLLGLLSGSNANAAKVYALNSNNSGHWNANAYPTPSTTWGTDNVESLLWSFVLDYTPA